jgi:hypothetical protein
MGHRDRRQRARALALHGRGLAACEPCQRRRDKAQPPKDKLASPSGSPVLDDGANRQDASCSWLQGGGSESQRHGESRRERHDSGARVAARSA